MWFSEKCKSNKICTREKSNKNIHNFVETKPLTEVRIKVNIAGNKLRKTGDETKELVMKFEVDNNNEFATNIFFIYLSYIFIFAPYNIQKHSRILNRW